MKLFQHWPFSERAVVAYGQRMLKVNKAAKNVAGYLTYENQEGPEQASMWLGIGANKLGLTEQEVTGKDLIALLGGRDPSTGEILQKYLRGDRRPAWEFVYSAPKYADLLWALQTNPSNRADILVAHDRAVADAVAFVETHSGASRVRVAGEDRAEKAGLVAAAFRHTLNRNNEPHIHSHVLVMNLALLEDGHWGAVTSRNLYKIQSTARALYEASLRARLAELGYRFEDDERDGPVLMGMPKELTRAFSTRTKEIEEFLGNIKRNDDKARQAAFRATRKDKEAHTIDELQEIWFETCENQDVDPEELLADLADRGRRFGAYNPSDPEWMDYAIELMLSEFGITENQATFTEADVIRAFADTATDGATLKQLESLVDAFFQQEDVLAIHVLDSDGQPTHARDEIRNGSFAVGLAATAGKIQQRYTLRSLLDIEESILDAAILAPSMARACQVDAVVVAATLNQADASALKPSEEQKAVIEAITTSGEFIELVRGVPGAGKTRSLAIASRIWESAGYSILGTSHTGRAADELGEGAKIQSRTLASLLMRAEREGIAPNTVVIVDEAGMADTRSLAKLVNMVREAEGKIVLVGDNRQLPSVAAGGMFGTLWRSKGGHDLPHNMRQVEDWARDALEYIRTGHAEAALSLYVQHGLVQTHRDEMELMHMCVTAWFSDFRAGIDTAILTHSNSDTEALNLMAHALMKESGELEEPLVHLSAAYGHAGVPERTYHRGETLVFLRNTKMAAVSGGARVDVRNSHTGKLLGFDAENNLADVLLNTGERVWVKRSYLEEHTAHGYARTIHKSQGVTIGRQDKERLQVGYVHLYRPELLGFEAAHVALSRATDSTRLYVLTQVPELGADTWFRTSDGEDVLVEFEDNDALSDAASKWNRSAADRSASSWVSFSRRAYALARAMDASALAATAKHLEYATKRLGAAAGSVTLDTLKARDVLAACNPAFARDPERWRLPMEDFELTGRADAISKALEAQLEKARIALTISHKRSHKDLSKDFRMEGEELLVLRQALAIKRESNINSALVSLPAEYATLIGTAPPVEDSPALYETWLEALAAITTVREQAVFAIGETPAKTTLEKAIGFSLDDPLAYGLATEIRFLRQKMTALADKKGTSEQIAVELRTASADIGAELARLSGYGTASISGSDEF
ncbi:MAG: relaxase domain-containing protein [Actinomycetota bacterium]|nr:relaxase domain-containing protein [Actinomycetota bacterium]